MGRIINQKDVASLFGTAYLRAATAQNAVSGFEKTCIWPPNSIVFDDADFLPATAMENPPVVENPTPYGNLQSQQISLANEYPSRTPSPSIIDQLIIDRNFSQLLTSSVIEQYMDNEQSTMGTVAENLLALLSQLATTPPPITPPPFITSPLFITPPPPAALNDLSDTAMVAEGRFTSPITRSSPSTKSLPVANSNVCHISPMALKPLPKMTPNITNRRRKAQRAEILTSTPIKDEQRIKVTKKQKAVADKDKRVIKNLKGKLSEKAGSSEMQREVRNRRKVQKETSGSKNISETAGSSGMKRDVRNRKKAQKETSVSKNIFVKPSNNATDHNYFCLICI